MGEWVRKKISQFGKVVSGATPSTSRGEFWNGNVIWITPNDLSKLKTPFIQESERKISDLGLKSCSTQLIPASNLVMSSRAPIGYFAIVQNSFTTNQGCKSIIFDKDQSPLFHYYNFLFRINEFKQKGEGTTFAEISKSVVENLEFRFPDSLEEQTAISTILNTIDQAIEKTEHLIAKFERIKTGLMQDLLTRGIDENGNIRSEETHEFKNSVLGRIPVEWEVKELEKLVEPNSPIVYGILMPGYGYDNGIPVIKVKDINADEIDLENLLLTSPEIAGAYERSKLKEGDLLFTIRGTVGRCAFVPRSLNGANITQDTARLRIVNVNSKFVRYYFDMAKSKTYIELNTIGLAVKGINLGELRKLLIAVPSKNESDRIVLKIDAQQELIKNERKGLAKFKNLKTALMQDLLTGKVRVDTLMKLNFQI